MRERLIHAVQHHPDQLGRQFGTGPDQLGRQFRARP
jgi:hypothetical protein